MKRFRNIMLIAAAAMVALFVFAPLGFAAEGTAGGGAGDGELSAEEAAQSSVGGGLRYAGIALGAGLAVLGGALGTARAQAAIGAGGTAAMTEKPELFGKVFILVALPETVIVLGFVIALMLLGQL